MSKDNSFNSDYKKLEKILEWFDSEDFDLDQAQQKFDKAQELVVKLKNKIKTAKQSVSKLEDLVEK